MPTENIAPEEITGTWELDPAHTRLGFMARHAMVTKVRGSFEHFAGEADINAQDPERSNAEVSIDTASITTGQTQRDEHLRSADFFDVTTFPALTFTSTKIVDKGNFVYEVTGDLNIKDVTKSVNFDLEFTGAVTDPFGNQRIGFEGKLVISRKDWGLVWNAPLQKGAGLLVSDEVAIELDLSLIKKS